MRRKKAQRPKAPVRRPPPAPSRAKPKPTRSKPTPLPKRAPKPKSLTARQREIAARYLTKAREAQPFVRPRLSTKGATTPAQRGRITRLHREIFGSSQGEKKHPSLYGKSVKAIKFRSAKQLEKAKRDLGQRTSKAIKVVFVKRRKLPGETDIESDPIIISRRDAPDIVINGWLIQVMEPINAGAYAASPVAEEARAIAALWEQFEIIKKAMAKPPREWRLKWENVEFSPHCGQHDYYGVNSTVEGLQALLETWRAKYNQRQDTDDHVQGWLTGITMTIRIGKYGTEQFGDMRRAQDAKRRERAKWRRKLAGRGARGQRHHPKRGARPKT